MIWNYTTRKDISKSGINKIILLYIKVLQLYLAKKRQFICFLIL